MCLSGERSKWAQPPPLGQVKLCQFRGLFYYPLFSSLLPCSVCVGVCNQNGLLFFSFINERKLTHTPKVYDIGVQYFKILLLFLDTIQHDSNKIHCTIFSYAIFSDGNKYCAQFLVSKIGGKGTICVTKQDETLTENIKIQQIMSLEKCIKFSKGKII